MKTLLTETADRAADYFAGLPDRAVAPSPAAEAGLNRFEEPLPTGPTTAEEILRMLDETAGPATVASAGPRYFGYVTGGALPATVAANWLATAWDQNGFSATASPVAARIESVALSWLFDLFGFPDDAGGAFVTGATMANFSGLAAARHKVLADVD